KREGEYAVHRAVHRCSALELAGIDRNRPEVVNTGLELQLHAAAGPLLGLAADLAFVDRAVGALVPYSEGDLSQRQIGDLDHAVFAGDAYIGMLLDDQVGPHPGVDIA